MMEEQKYVAFTEGFLCDKLVEYFQSYKDAQNPRPGEYFDNLFYVNALQKNPIQIPNHVLEPFKKLLKNDKEVCQVIHRAIVTFCGGWHGFSKVFAMDKEGRFKWQII